MSRNYFPDACADGRGGLEMEPEKILIQKEGKVAVATMSNPPANALSPALRDEFLEKLGALSTDSEVWVVIVTGEFDRYNSGISSRFRYCTNLEYGGGYNAT